MIEESGPRSLCPLSYPRPVRAFSPSFVWTWAQTHIQLTLINSVSLLTIYKQYSFLIEVLKLRRNFFSWLHAQRASRNSFPNQLRRRVVVPDVPPPPLVAVEQSTYFNERVFVPDSRGRRPCVPEIRARRLTAAQLRTCWNIAQNILQFDWPVFSQ